nr:hypothetical protein [Tanacetum cinerariifolium]
MLEEESRLSKDFGKCFIPQQELFDEQALHHNIDQSTSSPVKIEAPRELPKRGVTERLQAEEQEELTDKEKARLFVQFLEKSRKFFVAKRAEEKRNKPPIRAQKRSITCTYLKNMDGWKLKSLKNKPFANIQELFDKAMKKVNTFVDYKTELVVESLKEAEAEVTKGSSKRAGEELEQIKMLRSRRWTMIKNL